MNISKRSYYLLSVEHKPGILAEVITNLREHKVNLEGLWGFGTGKGGGEIILIPEDPRKFSEIASQMGWKANHGNCFRIEGEDEVGALVEPLEKAAKAGLNLRAVEAMGVGGTVACYLWCAEGDVNNLAQLIGAE